MRLRSLLVVFLLAGALSAQTKPPDFSGEWKFNPSKSTRGASWPAETVLVIKQSSTRIYFQYFTGKRMFAYQDYLVNGKEERTYSNKNETAYVSARWRKTELVVTTRHAFQTFLSGQSFSETDRWMLTEQGKTLTGKMSDGKVVVFEKEGSGGPPGKS